MVMMGCGSALGDFSFLLLLIFFKSVGITSHSQDNSKESGFILPSYKNICEETRGDTMCQDAPSNTNKKSDLLRIECVGRTIQ
jgi:hypothetical protein